MADKGRSTRSAGKHELLDDLGKTLARLAEASDRMRQRLDQVDPYEQPARWSALNDQIRGLDERISGLRDEQQRIALIATELAPLSHGELDALRAAIAALAQLVKAASTAAAVAEAAGTLAAVATEVARKTVARG